MKIYAPFGQRYEPVDANMVLSYQEARDGQLLEEGITEAGAMGSFAAAGTAYATHGEPMILSTSSTPSKRAERKRQQRRQW